MFTSIITENPKFPLHESYNISLEAVHLIKFLQKKNPANRLGYNGPKQIFKHPWFSNINFKNVLDRKAIPPVIPNLEHECSVENFDNEITKGTFFILINQKL